MEGGIRISSKVFKVRFEKRHEEVSNVGIWEKSVTSSAKTLPMQKLYQCRSQEHSRHGNGKMTGWVW